MISPAHKRVRLLLILLCYVNFKSHKLAWWYNRDLVRFLSMLVEILSVCWCSVFALLFLLFFSCKNWFKSSGLSYFTKLKMSLLFTWIAFLNKIRATWTRKSNLNFVPTVEVIKSSANQPDTVEANTGQITAILNKHKIKFSAIDESDINDKAN